MLSFFSAMKKTTTPAWSEEDSTYVWEVLMPPPPAVTDWKQNSSSTNCTLTVSAASSQPGKVEVQHRLSIVFGDVWFCAGQSNMYRAMNVLTGAGPHLRKGR